MSLFSFSKGDSLNQSGRRKKNVEKSALFPVFSLAIIFPVCYIPDSLTARKTKRKQDVTEKELETS